MHYWDYWNGLRHTMECHCQLEAARFGKELLCTGSGHPGRTQR